MKQPSPQHHLHFASVEEWMEAEGLTSLSFPHDLPKQNRLLQQLDALQKKLWHEHLASLSQTEREQLSAGTHPSQSHARAEQARPYLESFRKDFAHVIGITDVTLGIYHGDRLAISVHISEDLSKRNWRGVLPTYYRGFQVKVGFSKSSD